MAARTIKRNNRDPKPAETVIERDVAVGISWKHNVLGKLIAKVPDYEISDPNKDADSVVWSWIKLEVDEKPAEITVAFDYELVEGVHLVHRTTKGTRVINPGKGLPRLRVPINWTEKGPRIPGSKDDRPNIMNTMFFNQFGGEMHLEAFVVARQGGLAIGIQELSAQMGIIGTVAELKKADISFQKLEGTDLVGGFRPLWEHSAYPGADYLGTWPKTAGSLLNTMHAYKVLVPIAESEYAEWAPIDLDSLELDPPSGNRLRGWCTFFNVDSGYGFIMDEEGTTWFVHFSNLPRGMITLQPMQPYEFSLTKPNAKGQRQACNIVPIVTAVAEDEEVEEA